MSVDPTMIIGEILGEPAAQMRNPVNADYLCPHINSTCIKRGHGATDAFPVCSVWRWTGRVENDVPVSSELVCVCPKRLFAADLINDIIKHCWKGLAPTNPRLIHEIKMGGIKDSIGNVDCVLADLDAHNKVKEFISIELQAVDVTGSYRPAYDAVINSQMLAKKPTFGFNMANVYKRLMMQLIAKGYYHHHWGTKVVAVVQDVVFDDICRRIQFPPAADPKNSNIVFMVYKYVPDPNNAQAHILKLDRVVGTEHTNLQMAVLYRTVPSRADFCRRIESKISG
jgi:hypothetical protein